MTPQSASSRIYTDFSGLQKLKASARSESPEAVKAVAKEFEASFVEMMLKSLRDASSDEGIMESDGSRMYQDMFDKQIAVDISERGDFGVARVIEKQLSKDQQKPAIEAGDKQRKTDRRKQVTVDTGIAGLIKAQFAKIKQMPTVEAGVKGFGPSGQNPFNLTGLLPDKPILNQSIPARRNISPKPIIDLAPGSPIILNHTVQRSTEIVNKEVQRTTFKTPDEFIETMRPHAERAAKEIGVNPDLLIAQAALETGWGKRVIKNSDGSNSHNLFGIKASRSWNGDSVNVGSLEYRNGVAKKEVSAFRSYDSFTESFKDYVDFIKNQSRYEGAVEKAGNSRAYIKGLQTAGYATDPNYANKVMNILERKNLQPAWKGNA